MLRVPADERRSRLGGGLDARRYLRRLARPPRRQLAGLKTDACFRAAWKIVASGACLIYLAVLFALAIGGVFYPFPIEGHLP
jgi:hypothetical protein